MSDPVAGAGAACCATCAFASDPVRADAPYLICRRHAPVVQFDRTWAGPDGVREQDRYLRSAFAKWPRVSGDDWCGEWAPRKGAL